MSLLETFFGTLETILPVFAMVFIGLGLKRLGWIDSAFIHTASSLVFKATLPTLVFLSIVRADISVTLNPKMIAVFIAMTLLGFLVCWSWARKTVTREDRGVYIQGGFRGNCGIVGLALAANMYGDYGLSAGSLLLGVVIIAYNALSVIVLTAYQPGHSANLPRILADLIRNPLILSVLFAVPVAWSGITLPDWLTTSGDYFASLTLPLALLCIGGTLSLSSMRNDRKQTMSASAMKMVILPVICTLGAWLFGFRGQELGLMFLYFASPTAAASFVMVKALGGNERLAANIVALTTLAASLTITLGVFVLRTIGVI